MQTSFLQSYFFLCFIIYDCFKRCIFCGTDMNLSFYFKRSNFTPHCTCFFLNAQREHFCHAAHVSNSEIKRAISHVARVLTLLVALSRVAMLMWRQRELLVEVKGLVEGTVCPSTIISSETLERIFFFFFQKNYSNAAFESVLAEQQFRLRVFRSPTIQANCAA